MSCTIIITGLLLLGSATAAFAQTGTRDSLTLNRDSISSPTKSAFPTESDADEPARLYGDRTEWAQYVSANMRYPESAKRDNITGKVVLELIVDTKGRPQEVKIMKGIREDLNQEAIRLVQGMPDWVPAKKGGRLMNQKAMISVNFTPPKSVPDPRR